MERSRNSNMLVGNKRSQASNIHGVQDTGIKRFLPRHNYLTQFKSYYEYGYFNQLRNFMNKRLDNVNQSWNRQYSPFGEFRETSRKVTFNDSVMFHDYIDTESDLSQNSEDNNICYEYIESGSFGDCSFLDRGFIEVEGGQQGEVQFVNGNSQTPEIVTGDLSTNWFAQSQEPEHHVYFEGGDSRPSSAYCEVVEPKLGSAPNFLASDSNLDKREIESDTKKSLSDTLVGNTTRSSRNRVGTPRFSRTASNHNSEENSVLVDKFSGGNGDEYTAEEKIDVKEKKEDTVKCIPIHSSPTKTELPGATLQFQETAIPYAKTLPPELNLEISSISPDTTSNSNNTSQEINSAEVSPLQSQYCENCGHKSLSPSSVTKSQRTKTRKKSKRSSTANSDANKNKSQAKERKLSKDSVKDKHTYIDSSVLYIRRENASLQGQRLFNEIKDQISKYNVDKKILSTIFNKKFVALLLSDDSVRKYRANVNHNVVETYPNTVIIGSKWASKPDSTTRVTSAETKKLPLIPPKMENPGKNLKTEATSASKLQKETSGESKSRPATAPPNAVKEKLSSVSSPNTKKKKSPKKEASDKNQKLSKSKIPKKAAGVALDANSKDVIPKKIANDRKEQSKVKSEESLESLISRCSQTPRRSDKPSIFPSVKSEEVDLLKEFAAHNKSRIGKSLAAAGTNSQQYSSFDKWVMENNSSSKLSHGDERELKILRNIKRNPQMLNAYTTYRFGGPLSPTELSEIMRKMS